MKFTAVTLVALLVVVAAEPEAEASAAAAADPKPDPVTVFSKAIPVAHYKDVADGFGGFKRFPGYSNFLPFGSPFSGYGSLGLYGRPLFSHGLPFGLRHNLLPLHHFDDDLDYLGNFNALKRYYSALGSAYNPYKTFGLSHLAKVPIYSPYSKSYSYATFNKH